MQICSRTNNKKFDFNSHQSALETANIFGHRALVSAWPSLQSLSSWWPSPSQSPIITTIVSIIIIMTWASPFQSWHEHHHHNIPYLTMTPFLVSWSGQYLNLCKFTVNVSDSGLYFTCKLFRNLCVFFNDCTPIYLISTLKYIFPRQSSAIVVKS